MTCIVHMIVLAAVRQKIRTWVGEKPKLSTIKAVWVQLAAHLAMRT